MARQRILGNANGRLKARRLITSAATDYSRSGYGAAIFSHPEPRAGQLAAPVANPLNTIPALPGPTARVDAIFP